MDRATRPGTRWLLFTWSFTLSERSDGSTRLIVRERYTYSHRWAALLVEPTEVISFVMTQRMLRGIEERAERTALVRRPGSPSSSLLAQRLSTTMEERHR